MKGWQAMRSILVLCLVSLLVTGSASAKMKYPWVVETTNYVVSISKPIGYIQGDVGGRLEQGFASMASAGYPLFRRMQDEQAATVWFQCRVDDTKTCPYDGALDNLIMVTSDGDSVRVGQLLCSRINWLNPFTIPPLTILSLGMQWDRALVETPSQSALILFAGFPRPTNSWDVKAFCLKKGAEPCGSVSQRQ